MHEPLRLRRPSTRPNKSSSRVLSFADLMVQLLAFFLLLFAWSKPLDGARFSEGLGGFLDYLDSWGLPTDSKAEARRDARIQDVAGRWQDFGPRAAYRPRDQASSLTAPRPFADDLLYPAVLQWNPGSAEHEPVGNFPLLARSLASDRQWLLCLESAVGSEGGPHADELARRRLAAARAVLLANGCPPERIVLRRTSGGSERDDARVDLRLLRDLRSN